MENKLRQLQAPKRSTEMKQASFLAISEKVNQRKKRQIRSYYSVVLATAVLLALLTASLLEDTQRVDKMTATSPLTIERGYAIPNESTDNLTHLSKWYYFDKNKMNEDDLAFIQPYITKLYASNSKGEEFTHSPFAQLLLVMSDGQVAQVAVLFDYDNEQYSLVDINSKHSLPITIDEAREIEHMIIDQAEKSLVGLIEVLLFAFLVVLYIAAVMKISPLKKEARESKKRSFYFLVAVVMYVVYTFISGLSLYFFHSYNALFIASGMTILLLVKVLLEYYNGRFERSLFEVPVFFLFVLLVTIVRCL